MNNKPEFQIGDVVTFKPYETATKGRIIAIEYGRVRVLLPLMRASKMILILLILAFFFASLGLLMPSPLMLLISIVLCLLVAILEKMRINK